MVGYAQNQWFHCSTTQMASRDETWYVCECVCVCVCVCNGWDYTVRAEPKDWEGSIAPTSSHNGLALQSGFGTVCWGYTNFLQTLAVADRNLREPPDSRKLSSGPQCSLCLPVKWPVPFAQRGSLPHSHLQSDNILPSWLTCYPSFMTKNPRAYWRAAGVRSVRLHHGWGLDPEVLENL